MPFTSLVHTNTHPYEFDSIPPTPLPHKHHKTALAASNRAWDVDKNIHREPPNGGRLDQQKKQKPGRQKNVTHVRISAQKSRFLFHSSPLCNHRRKQRTSLCCFQYFLIHGPFIPHTWGSWRAQAAERQREGRGHRWRTGGGALREQSWNLLGVSSWLAELTAEKPQW